LLPLSLLQSNRLANSEAQLIEGELAMLREQIADIRARQSVGGFRLGNLLGGARREEQEITNLEARQARLSQRQDQLNMANSGWVNKCCNALRPFQVLLGVLGMLLTLLVVASLLITLIEKVAHSVCGAKCGYLLGRAVVFNPLDWMLVHTARYFPLDFVLFSLLLLFLFACLNYGLATIGVRLLWVKLFDVKRRGTLPQGLLLASLCVMFALMSATYTMTNLAPEYVQFGDQHYCNHTVSDLFPITTSAMPAAEFSVASESWKKKKPSDDTPDPDNPLPLPEPKRDCTNHRESIVPCDIYGPTSICTPTATSTIVNRILVQSPILGMSFFVSQWIFVGMFVIGLVLAVVKGARTGSVVLEEDDDEPVPTVRARERRPVERTSLLSRESA